MTNTRRTFLRLIGTAALTLPAQPRPLAAPIDIVMKGDVTGSDVWFDPVGLLVTPGAWVTWHNQDAGNSHTTTAYHPANGNHPLRIPPAAIPWNSDYLLPGESFSAVLTVPGVYDFFCIPHEMVGMVGRIIVADPGSVAPSPPANDDALVSAARNRFPSVETILRQGIVRRSLLQ
jgi:plastocyanin